MNDMTVPRAFITLGLLTSLLSACASSGTAEREATKLPPPSADSVVPRNFGPDYKYNELMIKDYDEMHALVEVFIRKAHQATSATDTGGEGEAVEYLGRALKLIFSRPDSDNMVAKLLADVRRELVGYNSYEQSLEGLSVDGILTARNKNASVIAQTTAFVLLNNLLGEIQPETENGNVIMRRIAQRLRDAKLQVSDEVKRELQLRGMFKIPNPSDEARNFLKRLAKRKPSSVGTASPRARAK